MFLRLSGCFLTSWGETFAQLCHKKLTPGLVLQFMGMISGAVFSFRLRWAASLEACKQSVEDSHTWWRCRQKRRRRTDAQKTRNVGCRCRRRFPFRRRTRRRWCRCPEPGRRRPHPSTESLPRTSRRVAAAAAVASMRSRGCRRSFSATTFFSDDANRPTTFASLLASASHTSYPSEGSHC